jgi:xanthine dehydrogenase accessory factor
MIDDQMAEHAQRLRAEGQSFVHATVVRAVRPTSVRPGDTALVLADGTIEGFVGGTCAQASVRLHAAQALQSGEAVLLRLEPGVGEETTEEADGVVTARNPCLSGGALDVFLDPQVPPRRLLIAGDTPIARALASVGRAAGFDVARADGPDTFPRAGDAAVVVAGHGVDEELPLARALAAGVGYVALVASPARGAAVLAALDVDEVARASVRTPAGLAIGARTPSEVAVAILAQLIAERGALAATGADQPTATAPADIATDPVCGMQVVAQEASVHVDGPDGLRVYFCRAGCRDAYLEREAVDAPAH